MRTPAWPPAPTRAGVALLAALLLAPAAQAQEPAAAAKPLEGKNAFSFERFEESLFDEKAKQIQAKMSAIRKKKIATLESIVNSNRPMDSQRKADVIFRLAEAYWDQSKYEYLLARDTYDREYDCFEEKRCPEPVEPEEDYSVALKFYRQILREHPNYQRIDEVMYYLGRAAIKAGKAKKDVVLQKEGVKRLNDLVQRHPQSRFVAQSHLALGEYFFETDSLFYAKTNYEKIITNFADSPMFNYALYKLGWVYFNLTEFEKTIETFQRVIASIGEGKNRARIEFRSQALNDLIVAYAELDGGWQMARTYFMKQVGEEDTYKKLEKMAGLLVSKDRDEEAISLYNHLIDHDKIAPRTVEFHDAILEVDTKLGDLVEVERMINEVHAFYDRKGKWWIANKANAEATGAADDLVSTGLIQLANKYHREAQKLDKMRKPARAHYERAANYYNLFLARFPDHKDAYVFNFYYAEILYDQMENYELAAVQYEKVLEKDTKGEFVEDAALGVIYAIEALMVKEGLREKTGQGVAYDKTEKSADLKKDALKPIPRTDLHPLEGRYIAAADKYVEVLSEALGDIEFRKKYPQRGKMIPEIMFIAAQTFYKHGQFAEAVNRLMVIFDLYPEHKMANIAVNTIIDAYARLKHWDKIETWARKLIEAKNFKVKTRAELEQMIAIAKTEYARDLTKQRQYDLAIRVQQEIVDEFGRKNKELASKALYNMGVIHESAHRFPEAVQAYEAVIKQYPKEDVAVQAQFDIGVLYENQTEFEKAAEAFIKMERFKDNPKASDAIRNAGLIYEALEKYRDAHATFTLYLKLFGDEATDAADVAFHSAEVLEREDDPKAFADAAKAYEKLAKKYSKKQEYKLRATAAAGIALKKADKAKHRKKVTKLLQSALKQWNKLAPPPAEGEATGAAPGADLEASTKAYAATAALELAEYSYDDYARLEIDAINKRGKFDVRMLKDTLIAKAEALKRAEGTFDRVLGFQDPGMAAAAAFREGQLLYEFAESLFNAPVPPELTDEMDIDEYRYQLEEVAAPIQEKALLAFTAALKQALDKNVYNQWSRLSATFAAKVNPDEFPLSTFSVTPDKTKDTLQSTSFIKVIRRGDTIVDFSE